jgi:hypothetical protein
VTRSTGPYPLAVLEGVRRRALDAVRREFARAVADSDAARTRAEATAGNLADAVLARRMAEGRPAGPTALDLDARCRWLARLEVAERALRDEAERRAEIAVRLARDEEQLRRRAVDAERQLRAVERHRSLWERARRRAREAAEEREQEDRSATGAPAVGRRYFPAP